MPALEDFNQPRPLEASHTDHGERAARPSISPRMEQAVTRLAASYHVDLSQPGANFNLDLPNQPQRWLFANLDGERIGVTRCQVDEENRMAPDLDMVFAVTSYGWEPREIIYAEGTWDEFVKVVQGQDLIVFDEQGNLQYDIFTEMWARKIEQEGRIDQNRSPDELSAFTANAGDEELFTRSRIDDYENSRGHRKGKITFDGFPATEEAWKKMRLITKREEDSSGPY